MTDVLSAGDVALRLGLTLIAGFLIGLDRGAHAHPAGLRTTILITVAAALAMIQANWLLVATTDTHNAIIRLDMMRLPLGILSGIGFIGAGAIVHRGDLVRGVTTAATLWLATVIGICFGVGQIALGVTGTAIALATLWLLRFVEAVFLPDRRGTLSIRYAAGAYEEPALHAALAARGFRLHARRVLIGPVETRVTCSGRYRGDYPAWSSALIRDFAAHPGVTSVEWRDTD